MAGSQETFGKKEREKKRLKKQEEKRKKREERKANPKSSGDMFVYVDENGHFTDTPPDPSKKVKVDAESIEIGIPKKEDRGEEEEVSKDKQGKVSFFDHSKGFGFIIDSLSQEKYFVHVSGLTEEVAENDKVSFELERGQKGMNAVRVKKI